MNVNTAPNTEETPITPVATVTPTPVAPLPITPVEEAVTTLTKSLDEKYTAMEAQLKRQQLFIDNQSVAKAPIKPLTEKEKYLSDLFGYGTENYSFGEQILKHLDHFIKHSPGHIQ